MNIFTKDLNEFAEQHKEEYAAAWPFPHIVIPDLFEEKFLLTCDEEFEAIRANEAIWKDPNQGFKERQTSEKSSDTQHEEYASNYLPSDKRWREKTDPQTPSLKLLLETLQGREFIGFIEKITCINSLTPDPGKRSAGLNWAKKGGYLHVHSDNTWNPYLEAYRCINTSLYINQDWKSEYGGHLELWDDMMNHHKSIFCGFNQYVIWSNVEPSYHGYPQPLDCPENRYRKNLILLYYRKEWPEQLRTTPEKKSTATWVNLPTV
jgi:Rps23 Pro-64 3,4-dihydroxylase Tpa1-like proline 4-hydroxylase